jgi:AraC-like DNA-binding protein
MSSPPPTVPSFFLDSVRARLAAILGDAVAEDLPETDTERGRSWGALSSALHTASEASGRPALGLEIAAEISVPNLYVFGPVISASRTLRDAIKYCDGLMLDLGAVPWVLSEVGEDAHLTFDPGSVGRVLEDLLVGLALNLVADFAGAREKPRLEGLLSYAEPTDLRPYAQHFPAGARFRQQRAGLCFSRSLLDRVRPGTHTGYAGAVLGVASKLLGGREQVQTWAASVERELRQLGSLSNANLETLGRRSGLSARALKRRLAKEGARFAELLARVRIERVEHLLLHTDLPISDIADAVGYADASTLSRAFKRAKGTTPSRFRARSNQGEPPLDLDTR